MKPVYDAGERKCGDPLGIRVNMIYDGTGTLMKPPEIEADTPITIMDQSIEGLVGPGEAIVKKEYVVQQALLPVGIKG